MTTSDEGDDASRWELARSTSPRAQVLIVDDQPINIRVLHQVFAEEHDVFMASSGEQALEHCRSNPPDLILLDVVMHGMSGLEVCRALKDNPETAMIPVIFVTSLNTPEEEEACWNAGCVDFITKPINAQTTRNRVRAHLTLKQQSDVLRRLAWIDGLTGIANKRQFDERILQEWRRCRRSQLPLSLAAVDIDHFKTYNDTYGHLAGDDCLRSVVKAIDGCMSRPGDFVARTGGEEFVCVLPSANQQGALAIAERVGQSVRQLHIPHAVSALKVVTVSTGVATMAPGSEESHEQLFARADRALYQAKRAGRARVMVDDGSPVIEG